MASASTAGTKDRGSFDLRLAAQEGLVEIIVIGRFEKASES